MSEKDKVEKAKAFIVYPTYKLEEGKAYVYLFGRLESGESFLTINAYRPYFFIKTKDRENAEKLIKLDYEETDFHDFAANKMTKVILDIPGNVPNIRKLFQDNDIISYEADIRFAYRYLIDKDLKSAIMIEGKPEDGRNIQPAYFTNIGKVFMEPKLHPLSEKDHYFPKLKVLAFDIETNRDASQLFSVSFYSEDFQTVLLLLHEKYRYHQPKIKNAELFTDEAELLKRFKEIILWHDPDIITGWNMIDFDLKILKQRFDKHKIEFKIGRVSWDCKLRFTDNYFTDSSAEVPGRIVLDGIHLMKISFVKLPDYKLNTAAKVFLGEEKLITSVDARDEIERQYEHEPQALVNYNLKDSKLAYDIIHKSKTLELSITRSMLTRMQVDRVKASIASLDSLYLKELQNRKLVAPTAITNESEERIKGGFVMDSKPGIYENILVFDFKSLYPSVIRTFNIDPVSFVDSKQLQSLNDSDRKKLIKAPNGAYFRNEQGILPGIIQHLFELRERAKKEKNELESNAIKILMNSMFGSLANPTCRFYSLEVANAITHFGQFIIKLSGEKIRELGYDVIYGDSVCKDTKVIIRENDKKIEIKKIEELFHQVDKSHLGKEYNIKKDIEVLTLDNKGRSLFRKINYVMRHKADKKIFRIFFTNICYIDVTEDHSLIGYVNKQKNNSLSDMQRLTEIKPAEIGKRARSIVSIKYIPRSKISSRNYPLEFYEFLGMFLGDGSFNTRNEKNYYVYLAGGNDTHEIIKKIILPLKRLKLIKNYWRKKKGDICINGLGLMTIMNKECRKNGKKIIPEFMFLESEKNICAFLNGLFSADGTVIIRNNRPIIRFTNTNFEIIEGTKLLLLLVGISNSVFSERKKNSYRGKLSTTFSKHIYIKDQHAFKRKIGFFIRRKNEKLRLISKDSKHKRTIKKYEFDLSRVTKIEQIPYKDYVYDIEVADIHRFFANGVLVHNTDSLFVNPNTGVANEAGKVEVVDYAGAIKIGTKIQKYIEDFYIGYIKDNFDRKSFLELKFEKTFKKFILPKVRGSDEGAKKRYAGIVEKDGKDKTEFTGLEFVRRDWTDAAKKFQLELLSIVFESKINAESEDEKKRLRDALKIKVSKYIKDYIADLKKGEYDSLLVYRKAIRKGVESYTKTTPPHIKAARKAGRTESGIIEYLQTINGPEVIEARTSAIDYPHYIEKQIKPIAESILGFFDISFDDLFAGSRQMKLGGF